jgi:hypothetical protein
MDQLSFSDLIIHLYHTLFIPKGIAEASYVFLTFYNCLAVRNTADVTGGKAV